MLSKLTNIPNYQKVLLVITTILLFVIWNSIQSATPLDQYTVGPQTFVKEVLVRGELKPERVLQVKSQISSNKAKLLWAVPDGTFVNVGDVLANFDTTAYDEKLLLAEQKLADAKATYDLVTRQFDIQKEEELKALSNAEKELEIAKLKVADMLNGKGPMARELIVIQLKQDQRSFDIAMAELSDFQLLLDKGHISTREYEKVYDNVTKLTEQVSLQQKQLFNFDTYDWPKIKREAEITEEKAKSENLSTIKISELNLHKYRSSVIKAQRDIVRVENQIEKIKLDIAACFVTAKIPGQVFHTKLPRAEGLRKIQVGDNIFSGQTYMQIPDTESLMFDSEIREFDLSLVQPLQKAFIKLDAFPNYELQANVDFISSLAKNDDNRDINKFSARLKVVTPDIDAKVGMYGQARIIVDQIANQLAIPLRFVKQDELGSWVYLNSMKKVYIKIGISNHEWVHIVEGLQQGDVILQLDS